MQMTRDQLQKSLFLAAMSAAAAYVNPDQSEEAAQAIFMAAAAADLTTAAMREYCDLITNTTINKVCAEAVEYGKDIYDRYAQQNDGGFPTIDQIHEDDQHNPCDDINDEDLKTSCSWFESIGMAKAQGLFQATCNGPAYAYQRMSQLNFSATILGSLVVGGAVTAAGIFYHQRKKAAAAARTNGEVQPLVVNGGN